MFTTDSIVAMLGEAEAAEHLSKTLVKVLCVELNHCWTDNSMAVDRVLKSFAIRRVSHVLSDLEFAAANADEARRFFATSEAGDDAVRGDTTHK